MAKLNKSENLYYELKILNIYNSALKCNWKSSKCIGGTSLDINGHNILFKQNTPSTPWLCMLIEKVTEIKKCLSLFIQTKQKISSTIKQSDNSLNFTTICARPIQLE